MAVNDAIDVVAAVLKTLGAFAAAASSIKYTADEVETRWNHSYFREIVYFSLPVIAFSFWITLAYVDPISTGRSYFWLRMAISSYASLVFSAISTSRSSYEWLSMALRNEYGVWEGQDQRWPIADKHQLHTPPGTLLWIMLVFGLFSIFLGELLEVVHVLL